MRRSLNLYLSKELKLFRSSILTCRIYKKKLKKIRSIIFTNTSSKMLLYPKGFSWIISLFQKASCTNKVLFITDLIKQFQKSMHRDCYYLTNFEFALNTIC